MSMVNDYSWPRIESQGRRSVEKVCAARISTAASYEY